MLAQMKASNFISERFNSFHSFMTPSSLLFFSTTTMGTLIVLSSNNWLLLWIGIELNLLSFVPLIASSQLFQETEARVKYFIIQAIGRGVILIAGVISISAPSSALIKHTTSLIFLLSIVVKLGMAPCHQWLPHVMRSISWLICLVLSTWQKVSPLIILNTITPHNITAYITFIAIASAIVGGLGGANQSQIRALLAYSSIGHIGWILIAIQFSSSIFSLYFITYLIITSRLILIIFNVRSFNSNFNSNIAQISYISFAMIIIIIFRLGGLPPFLGFLPKWIIINTITAKEMFLILITLITGSLLNLFYYFSILFNFITIIKTCSNRAPTPSANLILTSLCTLTPLILYL